VENILFFKEKYKEPQIITLGQNYRSSQKILDLSEKVIKQSSNSLRNLLPEVSKKIISAREFEKTDIHLKSFPDRLREYDFISKEIRRLIDYGVNPSLISVISRKHQSLLSLSAFLEKENVPFSYIKKKNIWNEPLILEIVEMVYFINSIADNKLIEADDYLPVILSFPFWQIDREKIWRLSLKAKNQSWLYLMIEGDDPKLKKIAKFFIDLSVEAKSTPAPRIIDKLIGGGQTVEEDDFAESTKENTSPFRNFYFNDVLSGKYIELLSALKVFINALREYKKDQNIYIKDVVEFVEIYKKNGIELLDESVFTNLQEGVSLLTTHSAKGLEFDFVFILSANENEWLKAGRRSNISLPKNIKIRSENDEIDDKIRLFYVALTRAKHTLYITRYEVQDDGSDSLIIPFIAHLKDDFENIKLKDIGDHPLQTDFNFLVNGPYIKDETAILKELVKDYQMPVTHFNNFIDVSSGGPNLFLEQNLLLFPQSKSISGVFGTAMHEGIKFIYSFFKKEGNLPDIDLVKNILRKVLREARLDDFSETQLTEKSEKILSLLLKGFREEVLLGDFVEVDFKNQGVVVGDAHLTGKVDRIRIEDNNILVTDWKTGKAENSWQVSDSYKKIKLSRYRRQLIFYKILLENSRDFSKYKVSSANLFFLEPVKDSFVSLPLDFEKEEILKTEKLISIVYKKIKNLDFPDITKYSPDYKGCIELEEDLLEGKV
jgi:DNA helicase-2/ATP-dependent DNA helicase PcrA